MFENIHRSASEYLAEMQSLLARIDSESIEAFANLLVDAHHNERRVFVFGNGGSASTASHHACDYMKTAAVDGRPRLRAFSLVDNVGLGTAIGNDLGYESVFEYTLETYAEQGDIAVAISSSGNSSVGRLAATAWKFSMALSRLAFRSWATSRPNCW